MDRGAWRVQSMGSQRVGHDWSDWAHTHTCFLVFSSVFLAPLQIDCKQSFSASGASSSCLSLILSSWSKSSIGLSHQNYNPSDILSICQGFQRQHSTLVTQKNVSPQRLICFSKQRQKGFSFLPPLWCSEQEEAKRGMEVSGKRASIIREYPYHLAQGFPTPTLRQS